MVISCWLILGLHPLNHHPSNSLIFIPWAQKEKGQCPAKGSLPHWPWKELSFALSAAECTGHCPRNPENPSLLSVPNRQTDAEAHADGQTNCSEFCDQIMLAWNTLGVEIC